MPHTSGRRCSVPGIEDVDPVEAPEVLDVSRHDSHLVNQGGRAEDGIAKRRTDVSADQERLDASGFYLGLPRRDRR